MQQQQYYANNNNHAPAQNQQQQQPMRQQQILPRSSNFPETVEQTLKLYEQNLLIGKIDSSIVQASHENFDENLWVLMQDLRQLFICLISLHLQQPAKLDSERLEKLMEYCKQKLTQDMPRSLKLATGHSLTEEFDIGIVEVCNLKYQELQAQLAAIPQQQQQQQQQRLIQEHIQRLITLINTLKLHEVVQMSTLLTHLDEGVLFASGLMEQKQFTQRRSRAITQLIYEQQKFNLLREEDEGFSKLLVELNQTNINKDNIAVVKKNVEALIGFFNLDPNRVLDIMLDSFTNHLWNREPYITLLREYKGEYIAQVLGFKFQCYNERLQTALKAPAGQRDYSSLEQMIPKQLCLLTAILIAAGLVTLEDIWPHLSPKQQQSQHDLDEVETLLKRQIKLAQYQYDHLFMTVTNRDAYEGALKQRIVEQESIRQERELMHYNCRLWLIWGFVRINHWELVEEVLGKLYQWRYDLTLHRPLLQALLDALSWFIEPLYMRTIVRLNRFLQLHSKQTPSSSFYTEEGSTGNSINRLKQATSSKIFFDELPKLLKILNVGIAFDQKLFLKTVKLVLSNFKDNPERAKFITGEVFIPALSLVESNNQLSAQVWAIWQQADFNMRYMFYTQQLTQTYLQNLSLLQSLIATHDQVLKWLRRFSADNVKQSTRQVAKLASGNALVLFASMLKQAKQYDNMIEAVNMSMAACSELALDICAHTVIRAVSDSQEDALDKEANVQEWLQNLAKFAAIFFKKYFQVDIVGLLTYLLNKMRIDHDHTQMIILREVVANMFGWSMFNVDEMTATQLSALAGGFALRLELMSQTSQFKRRTKSSDSLVALFWERTNDKPVSMALSLMANLAKMTQHVLHGVQTDQMTLVSKLYDRIHFVFLQFTETLGTLETHEMYAKLLPPRVESILTINYNLPPTYVMYILRGSLKPIQELSDEEFDQKVHLFKSILDMHLDQRLRAVTDDKEEYNEYFHERDYMHSRKEEVWLVLNPKLYTIFWYLTLQSLIVPDEIYLDQVKKLQRQIDEARQGGGVQAANSGAQGGGTRNYEKLKKQKELLERDHEKCRRDQAAVQEFLKRKLPECFVAASGDDEKMTNHLSTVFIQYCVYPRLMFSASDSLYAFHFIRMLAQYRVPKFNILQTLAQVLKCIVPSMHCCTINESDNLGIFFLELFSLINEWTKPEVWDRDCEGYHGFSKLVGTYQPIKLLEFQQIADSIQKRFTQLLAICFQNTKHPMKTQCALKILNRMLTHFPTIFNVAKYLLKQLQVLVDQKASIDGKLYTMAVGCKSNLEKKMLTMPDRQPDVPPPVPTPPVATPEPSTTASRTERESHRKGTSPAGGGGGSKKMGGSGGKDKEKESGQTGGDGAASSIDELKKKGSKDQGAAQIKEENKQGTSQTRSVVAADSKREPGEMRSDSLPHPQSKSTTGGGMRSEMAGSDRRMEAPKDTRSSRSPQRTGGSSSTGGQMLNKRRDRSSPGRESNIDGAKPYKRPERDNNDHNEGGGSNRQGGGNQGSANTGGSSRYVSNSGGGSGGNRQSGNYTRK